MQDEFKNKVIILGVAIDDISSEKIKEKIREYLTTPAKMKKIYTPNPEICLRAERDENFRDILNAGDLKIPDGIGLKFGAKILGQKLNNRVTGTDLGKLLLEIADRNSLSVAVVRRVDSLADANDLESLFRNKYPKVTNFVFSFDGQNYLDQSSLRAVSNSNARFVFVALGSPYQEQWIDAFAKTRNNAKIAIGIGGAFDFFTDKIKRAPNLVRKLGFEWAYRLYQEPKRLKRIKNAVADFLLTCYKWKNRIEKEYRGNVLGVIKSKSGKYLIQKNIKLQQWQFPQGGIQPGEDGVAAIMRECEEELGIKQSLLKLEKRLPPTYRYQWPGYAQLLRGYRGQEQNAYLLRYLGDDSDIKISLSHEAEDYKWVAKNEILDSVHPVRRSFIQKFIKDI